jgi:hypothetical protein
LIAEESTENSGVAALEIVGCLVFAGPIGADSGKVTGFVDGSRGKVCRHERRSEEGCCEEGEEFFHFAFNALFVVVCFGYCLSFMVTTKNAAKLLLFGRTIV